MVQLSLKQPTLSFTDHKHSLMKIYFIVFGLVLSCFLQTFIHFSVLPTSPSPHVDVQLYLNPAAQSRRSLTFVVSSDEAQNVLVSQHHSLVDLSLAEPGALLTGGEDLHSHLLPTPLTPPHFPETPLSDALLEDDGPGDGPLDQQRQAWRKTGRYKMFQKLTAMW